MVRMSMESLPSTSNNDDSKNKYRQISLSEKILLHGIIDLIKKYSNDLEIDEDLFEDEKFRLNGIIEDLRKLLEEVEKYYADGK
jgi:hypothetical protein